MTVASLIRRVSSDQAFAESLASLIGKDTEFLHGLAAALRARGETDAALDIYALIRQEAPADQAATLNAVQLLSEKERIEEALELLVSALNQGMAGGEFAAAIRAQLYVAARVHGQCVASNELDSALKICELLAALCPGVTLFPRARIETLELLQRRHADLAARFAQKHFQALNDLACQSSEKLDFDAELQCRLEIFRHKLDHAQHSVARVINIAHALSRLLRCDVDGFDADRRARAEELLAGLRSTPATGDRSGSADEEAAAAWEHAMRLLLGTIDLAAVFDRPATVTPPLPAHFVSASGESLDIAEIAARCDALDAKVLFVTSTSGEYFERHARTYVSSILRSCDCPCMVFVYLCLPKNELAAHVPSVGIDDPRLVYCSDEFDPTAETWKLFLLARREPLDLPGIYYASSGLCHMDLLLERLRRPLFVTGIDTILQSGVVDLVERFQHADVVLNQMGPHVLLGSQLVNNLVLVYPTKNGFMFAQFLKSYLGGHLAQVEQPEFLDQLDLHMAKHHIMATGADPKIGYFAASDINNHMFHRGNFRSYIDNIRSYRFLNIFAGGCKEDALTADECGLPPDRMQTPCSEDEALVV